MMLFTNKNNRELRHSLGKIRSYLQGELDDLFNPKQAHRARPTLSKQEIDRLKEIVWYLNDVALSIEGKEV